MQDLESTTSAGTLMVMEDFGATPWTPTSGNFGTRYISFVFKRTKYFVENRKKSKLCESSVYE